MGARTCLFAFLICLPAVLCIAVGSWLVYANVPRAIRTAPARIGREYREIAETMEERPDRVVKEGERRKGWWQVGRIEGKPWGYVVEGDAAVVWRVVEGSRCHWVEQPAIRPFPYALVFYWGGGLVGIALVAVSVLAVSCFVQFMSGRDDFLAATAHDLTTPLVGLRRTIGRDDEEARRLVERLTLIVDNIKGFLRLGGRRAAPELKPCDILAVCREAYRLFAADYEDAVSGPVDFQVSQDLKSVVMADETLTLQILWNLFGNDLKYAAPYGKVVVRLREDGEHVSVEFADEGQGMTSRQRRKAFDRYYRAKTVLETGKGGFGIGLCAARELARAMGGDLTVRANAPKGCVFSLSLPGCDFLK